MDMIHTTEALTFQDFLRYPALRVEEGEFAFVTGRSGAGKSTYLRLLNGSIPADPGCIFYRGIPLEEYQILPYRRQVLLVPQAVYLIPGTILDNFHFYYDVRRQQRIDGERAAEFLRRCCLDFPVDTSCDTLSGGERPDSGRYPAHDLHSLSDRHYDCHLYRRHLCLFWHAVLRQQDPVRQEAADHSTVKTLKHPEYTVSSVCSGCF